MIKIISSSLKKTLSIIKCYSYRQLSSSPSSLPSTLSNKIKVISLDVTGTILIHSSVSETYHKIAIKCKLPNPPTPMELKQAFKIAYQNNIIKFPCFGYYHNLSCKNWWKITIKDTLILTGRNENYYTLQQFNNYFNSVYQHYGTKNSYEILYDTLKLLNYCKNNNYSIGMITNNSNRMIDDILPMLDLNNYFDWFLCSHEIGYEKPSRQIFDYAYNEAKYFTDDNLKRSEILHIGDNFAADFCGARAAGLSSLYLDRSNNSKVKPSYQELLLQEPHYDGKCEEDIKNSTIHSLDEVIHYLESSNV